MNQIFRTLFIFFSLLLIFSAVKGQQAGTVTMKGILLNNKDVAKIYLDGFQAQAVVTDSANIGPSGEFSFSQSVPETGFMRLRITDKNFLMFIVSEGENIEVTAPADQMGNDPLIKGSPQTELMFRFNKVVMAYDRKTDSLNAAGKSYEKSPQRDSVMPVLQKEYEHNENLRVQALKDFILTNRQSLVSLFFIDKLDIDEYFDVYKTLSEGLSSKFPGNPYIESFQAKVNENAKVAVGSPAPEIALPDTSGKTIALSSIKGKAVIIDFWAAWCGPCRRENPSMVKLYQKYHDKGLEIYGVSLDKSRDAWVKAIRTDNLTWTEVSDLQYWKSEAAKAYRVGAIPHTVLLDQNGIIIGKKLRGDALEEKLKEIFGF